MIHHVSIAAADPEQVAGLLASLWRGDAFPFPPVARGSWVAMAGDEFGTTIEVYPIGTELRPGEEAGTRKRAPIAPHEDIRRRTSRLPRPFPKTRSKIWRRQAAGSPDIAGAATASA